MKLTTFYIYLLTIGNAKYVGKTTQDPKLRLNQHLSLLQDRDHHTDKLQEEWNKSSRYKHKVLKAGKTFFKRKIALSEQRAINRFSNCNEQKAIANSAYSFTELGMDVLDFVGYNWFIFLLGLITIILLERFM